MDSKGMRIVLMVAAIAAGMLAFRVLGFSVLIVLGGLFGAWHLFHKKLGVNRHLAAALTWASAHALWFLAGLLLAPLAGISVVGMMIEVGPDLVILAALVAWIYVARSRASLYVLIVYEVASLAFNAYVLATDILPLSMQLNLAAHMLLRLATVVTAMRALGRSAEFAKTPA